MIHIMSVSTVEKGIVISYYNTTKDTSCAPGLQYFCIISVACTHPVGLLTLEISVHKVSAFTSVIVHGLSGILADPCTESNNIVYR